MTNKAPSRSPRYNKLKKRALKIFERHGGWLSPPEWAVLAGFYPTRAAYSYLLRLHRFGLLERRCSVQARVRYQLSPRGRFSWSGWNGFWAVKTPTDPPAPKFWGDRLGILSDMAILQQLRVVSGLPTSQNTG